MDLVDLEEGSEGEVEHHLCRLVLVILARNSVSSIATVAVIRAKSASQRNERGERKDVERAQNNLREQAFILADSSRRTQSL